MIIITTDLLQTKSGRGWGGGGVINHGYSLGCIVLGEHKSGGEAAVGGGGERKIKDGERERGEREGKKKREG